MHDNQTKIWFTYKQYPLIRQENKMPPFRKLHEKKNQLPDFLLKLIKGYRKHFSLSTVVNQDSPSSNNKRMIL